MECIVRVRFLGRFKTDVGMPYIDFQLAERTPIKNLLRELRGRFGTLASAINDDGAPSHDVMVLVNGTDINVFDSVDELYIDDGDEVLLIPVTHGGAI
ncbi:MAG: MoaD/ThiS family protein [Ignisphaera sp.]|nr:MoaD/ThiS family protein [Ignisphaera sp.]MDW8085165.1 MoaD/ThiS family protein [Ignisphaera sp.]